MSKRAVHRNPAHPSRENPRQVAHAPYNFVQLPEQVAVYQGKPPTHAHYENENHYTGRIHCTLETRTPLYIRGKTSVEEFDKLAEASDERDVESARPEFYLDPATGLPMIPGSSLRGMLRSLVEIISYSKFGPVSDRAIYFRSVADQTAIRLLYQDILKGRKAGWIEQQGQNYFIRPAPEIDGHSYYKVGDRFAEQNGVEFESIRNEDAYKKSGVQLVDVYFRPGEGDQVGEISPNGGPNFIPAQMICSGYMNKKGKHWVVPKPDPDKAIKPLEISPELVADYLNSLTELQLSGDLDPQKGVLKAGTPVFYIQDQEGKVQAIGHTGFFRLPYRRPGSDKAVRLSDMVPTELKDPECLDLAEAIFGYVKGQKGEDVREQATAGRLRVCPARLSDPQQEPWLTQEPVTPRILSGPKPTSYQLYLTQPTPDERRWQDDKGRSRRYVELAHYGSAPDIAEPRGHKVYWHQRHVQRAQDFQADPEEVKEHPKQYTKIRPVKPGVKFEFEIHFENLSQVELGALWWALNLPGGAGERCHRLGMGKPLGLGSVKLTPALFLDDRQARYQQVWAENGTWNCPSQEKPEGFENQALEAFENEVMRAIGKPNSPYQAELRIQMLQALLTWPEPVPELVKYLTIEPNEYKDRRVLPDPLHLQGLSPADPKATSPLPSKEVFKRPKGEPRGPRHMGQAPHPASQPASRAYYIPELPDEPSQAAKDLYNALFGSKEDEE